MSQLDGKIALITGGGSGLGRAMALAFADAGADVAVASRTRADVEAVAQQAQVKNRRGLALEVDVSSIASATAMVEQASAAFGRIDILVNSIQLTRTLALELARFNVRVNALAPGYFRTDMNAAALDDPIVGPKIVGRIPLRRAGKPEEIGAFAVYLASDDASFVTGKVITINGGEMAQ